MTDGAQESPLPSSCSLWMQPGTRFQEQPRCSRETLKVEQMGPDIPGGGEMGGSWWRLQGLCWSLGGSRGPCWSVEDLGLFQLLRPVYELLLDFKGLSSSLPSGRPGDMSK